MNLIAHFDEIFLKGDNQKTFIDCLKNNIRSLFAGSNVTRVESGLWIENIEQSDLARLALVPGVANFGVAYKSELEISKITEVITNYEWGSNITSFRIKAERSDKRYPLNSVQIEKQLGTAINKKFGYKVKLENPELTIHVDIASEHALIYGNLMTGASGLPIGTAGKVMCLLSGGIDSPVAAYKMMCRGAEVELVHFQNQTQVTEEVSQKIMDLAAVLARYHGKINLHIVPFAEWQKQIVINIPSDYRMLATRRIMFKIADNIAKKQNCLALVTGDSLGQVASQTLENLSAVYQSVDTLKLSPLIGENKSTIIALARLLGTLDISNRPYEDCCSLFVAKHPQTRAKLDTVLDLESRLDLSTIDKQEYISYHIGM
ncbi:MAG: tRNA uracil 4-sulfurtransferase ThiI [Candidatus Magasanikbacteria bacterium]|jgi:thiamine biosynthesis protein ThiI